MLHYYLQSGHSLNDLLGLSYAEKLLYKASMEIELERGEKTGS